MGSPWSCCSPHCSGSMSSTSMRTCSHCGCGPAPMVDAWLSSHLAFLPGPPCCCSRSSGSGCCCCSSLPSCLGGGVFCRWELRVPHPIVSRGTGGQIGLAARSGCSSTAQVHAYCDRTALVWHLSHSTLKHSVHLWTVRPIGRQSAQSLHGAVAPRRERLLRSQVLILCGSCPPSPAPRPPVGWLGLWLALPGP